MNQELLICQCENTEHQMVFRWDEDVVYVTYHLTKLPFLQRLMCAIRYIFGYTSKYGDFDEMILNPDDTEKLERIVKHLKKTKDAESDT